MTTFAELDALSTDDLREQAFTKARRNRDVGFFWDLTRHLPGADDAEVGDNSLGDIGPELENIYELWREFRDHEYGDNEPMIRAKFIDYLLRPEK